jgi:MFS family permease
MTAVMALNTVGRPASIWRNRDYVLLWSGQTVSVTGSVVSGIAFPFLILSLLHSPAQAGLVSATESLPFALLALVAGALVDRWNRKRIMIVCDIGRALALGSIPLALWLDSLTMLQLYLVALTEGTLFVFFSLAESSCLPHVVSREQLTQATGATMASEATAGVAGPPLSGLLFAAVGRFAPFLVDAVSYAISAISLLFIATAFQGEREETPANFRREVAEGLRWLWSQPVIRFLAFLTGGVNFVFAGASLTLIVLAKQDLHASTAAIGLVAGATSLGAILGSLLAGRVERRLRFGPTLIGCCWFTALLWPLFAVSTNLLEVGSIAAAVLFVSPIYSTVQFSYRLSRVPDELLGRVNSVFRLIAFAGQPLGVATSGLLLGLVGPRGTVLLAGTCFLLLALTATVFPYLRQAPPLAAATA